MAEPSELEAWSVDPSPNVTGVLLSNMIEKYIGDVNLIENYDLEECLKPASYDFRLDKECIVNGEEVTLGEEGGEEGYLKIPPNGIAWVSTYEIVNIPRYLIARFNLRIKWVYKGILLGTGPQVDPGYQGQLHCPLYNLTEKPIRIKYLERFATIDFIKTTDYVEGVKEISTGVRDRKTLRDQLNDYWDVKSSLLGLDNSLKEVVESFVIYKDTTNEYLERELSRLESNLISTVDLSVEQMRIKTDEADRTARYARNFGAGIAVAVVFGVIAAYGLIFQRLSVDFNYLRAFKDTTVIIEKLQKDVSKNQDILKQLNSEIEKVKELLQDKSK